MADAADLTRFVINPIILAEFSIGYNSADLVDAATPESIYQREDLPWQAAFLAAKCYVDDRRRGGLALLTRDPARYRTYFPKLEIVAP